MCELARSSAGRSRLDSSQPVAVDVRPDEVDGEDTDIVGTDLSTLEDLASGKRFPGIELLWMLAQALDVPCTAFIEEPAMAALLPAPSAIRTTST